MSEVVHAVPEKIPSTHAHEKHCNLSSMVCNSQERLESMVQPVCGSPTMLGKSPPSPSKATPEWLDAKKAISSRRRTTSNTRHR